MIAKSSVNLDEPARGVKDPMIRRQICGEVPALGPCVHDGRSKDSNRCRVSSWLGFGELKRAVNGTFPSLESRTESRGAQRKLWEFMILDGEVNPL